MKIFLIITVFLFSASASRAFFQPSDQEESSRLTEADTVKVLTLSESAAKFLTSNPPKAKQLAEEALQLATQLDFLRGKALALNCLSDYYFRQSDYFEAIEYATQMLKITNQLRDSVAMSDAYRLLGNINTFGLKQYDQALDYHVKAIDILENQINSAKIKLKLAAEYGSITWIYAITKKNLAEAHRLASQGLLLALEARDQRIVSYNYNSKGLLFFVENKYDSALVNLYRSINYANQADDKAVITYNKSIIGNIYLNQQRYDDAFTIFNEALAESKKLNLREVIKEAYEGLAKVFEKRGNFNEAYRYHVRYSQLKDSLLNLETAQKTLSIQKEYEAKRSEAIIAQFENEKKMAVREKSVYIIIFSVGLFTFLIIIWIVLRSNHHRKMNNRLLLEKNNEIKTQNEELLVSREEIATQRDVVEGQNIQLQQANRTKDKLFSIIGHDLRSPIASLRSLISMVNTDIITFDELKTLTPKINQNVGNLHEMLENLLQWSHTQMTGFKSQPSILSIHTIVARKVILFTEAVQAKNITLINNTLPEHVAYADENQVRIIIRNLIHNAIKFTNEGGKVTIDSSAEDDWMVIRVTDTGVGITEERIATLFESNAHYTSPGTKGEKGTGLGLILCKEMAEVNGGKIVVKSKVGIGSTFQLHLKTRP